MFDYRQADLSKPDRLLCDYAVRLTLEPASIDEAEVTRLKSAGFSDAEITIAVQVIGYFNYINRIAEGLGVEPESWMTLSREDWRARKSQAWL